MALSQWAPLNIRLVLATCLLICGSRAQAQSQPVELSRGHKLLMSYGELQIFAWAFAESNGFNPTYFAQSNLTGVVSGGFGAYRPELYGPPGAINWGIIGWGQETVVVPESLPYFSRLKTWCFQDEQDLAIPSVFQQTVNWMNTMHADPRVNHVVLHTVQWGEQFGEPLLREYMAAAQPDMLMFDYYVWGTGYPWLYSNGSPAALYRALSKYRRLSLAGNDGTGTKPIPFGNWLQTWTPTSKLPPNAMQFGHRMSESELRMDQFAGWAFGSKYASAFTYDSGSALASIVGPLLFDRHGPKALPTTEFYLMAETNRQSRNLGRSLLTLLSRDVRMVRGPRSWENNGVELFDGTSDSFLETVSATNLGTTNEGQPGDVLLGWFRPLQFIPEDPDDQSYFMVVNGLTWKDTSSADTQQLIHLEFDFGDSGITSLQRLSRDTGKVEFVPLMHDGGSLYHLDLILPGGTGDLFKYNTGSTFVSIYDGRSVELPPWHQTVLVPEPAGTILSLLLASCLMSRQRPRR